MLPQASPRKRGRPCKNPEEGPMRKRTEEERVAYNAKQKEWRMNRLLRESMSKKKNETSSKRSSSRDSLPAGSGINNRLRSSSVAPKRSRPSSLAASLKWSMPRTSRSSSRDSLPAGSGISNRLRSSSVTPKRSRPSSLAASLKWNVPRSSRSSSRDSSPARNGISNRLRSSSVAPKRIRHSSLAPALKWSMPGTSRSSSRDSSPARNGISNRLRSSSVAPTRGRPSSLASSQKSSVIRTTLSANKPRKRGRPARVSLPSLPSVSTPPATSASSGKSVVQKRREELRKRDEECRETLGLHFEGKKYCLAKQESVDEDGGDYVKEIQEGYTHSMDYWQKKEEKMMKSNCPFLTDFVVGCTAYAGDWDEARRIIRVKILLKYSEFPYAYWQSYDSSTDAEKHKMVKAIQEFRWRESLLCKVRKEMREECERRGEDFDKMYPHVFLPNGKEDTYATDAAMKRRTLLRAREATINLILRRVGLPPIIVEEWTGDDRDDDSLINFVFTAYVHPSKKVQKAESEIQGNRLTHKCGVGCCCAGGSSKECNCCPNKNDTVECNDECACTIEQCPSRIMQRGRQTPMAVIRHPVKGWTTRALEDIPARTYVGDYAGEMLTAWENKQLEQTYSTDLPFALKSSKKDGYEHRRLAMTSLRKGNEGRWHSHSCDYNMELESRYVSRKDWAFARLAFFTIKDVKIGQELTWNYHGDDLLNAQASGEKFRSELIPRCLCGSSTCMIKPWDECSSDEEENESDFDSFSEGEGNGDQKRKVKRKRGRPRKTENICRSSDEENEM